MDSLTQIVLGAAVGEIVLGRKVGNRAMIWGAIAATIPDLDIVSNAFMHPIEALAIHRGLSHSIFFAVLFPWVIGWMTHRYYENDYQNNKKAKWILRGLIISICLLFINSIAYQINQGPSWTTLLITVTMVSLYIYRTRMSDRKVKPPSTATYNDWVKLYFWAIFTHPLLDCCTTFGTQLFQPFSDYRVAFNNISVVDPIYTVPFLVFLVLASFFIRSSNWRKGFNYAGLTISLMYMAWTLHNKHKVNQVFEKSLADKEIAYDRYMTSPTIFNNVLWYGVAQERDTFYTGFYSILDKEPKIKEFQKIVQNNHLLDEFSDEKYMKIVKWFSDGYYAVETQGTVSQLHPESVGLQDPVTLLIRDLRFGIIKEENGVTKHSTVFNFNVKTEGGFDVIPFRDPGARKKKTMSIFWERIKGI